MREMRFVSLDLTNADLTGAILDKCDLRSCLLLGADLTGASLRETALDRADVTGVVLKNCDLTGATLQNVDLSVANVETIRAPNADLRSSKLVGLALSNSTLAGADLRDANLSQASLRNVSLEGARLTGAELVGVDLTAANLQFADLSLADLRDARLAGCNLQGAMLAGVQLQGADLNDVILGVTRLSRQAIPKLPGGSGPSYRETSRVYAILRSNFDSQGQYADSNWAYVRERRARRASHWPGRFLVEYPEDRGQKGRAARQAMLVLRLCGHTMRWFVDLLSDYVLGYGIRITGPFIFGVAVVLLFSIIFFLGHGVDLVTPRPGVAGYTDCLLYSSATFATIGLPSLAPVSRVDEALTAAEAFLGIATLAMILFSVGNRINRG
jgi:uncharacterized protein YjbI with pentapeptide repeats